MRTPFLLLALAAALQASAQSYQLSPLFGTDGVIVADVATGSDQFNAHALQPDGKLLLSGDGYDIGTNSYHASLIRIDTVCGNYDPTFGDNGKVAVLHQQRTRCNDIVLQPDGKIVGCGMIAPNNFGSQQWPGVFRLHPDGSVDSTFNGTGFNRLPFVTDNAGDFTACLLGPNNTIVCTGAAFGGAVGAMRFTSAGVLDATYGNNGIASVALPSFSPTADGTGVMRPDGSVITIALGYDGVDYMLALAQFDPTGQPDPAFGTNGLAFTSVYVNNSTPDGGWGAALLPDGRLLVSGTLNGNPGGFLMACFLPDGTLDSSYGTDGVSVVPATSNSTGASLHLLNDGSTLQFGYLYLSTHALVLMRDPDGEVVTSFGTNGFVQVPYTPGHFNGGLRLPSGRIIGYGTYTEGYVARLTTDPGAEHFADLGADVEGCGSGPVLLDAGAYDAYLWSDGSTDQTLAATASDNYWVQVTDTYGCADTDTVLVTLHPLPPAPVIDAVGAVLSTTAVGDLQWYLDGGPIAGATGASHTALQNGSYTVSVTDANGCSSTSGPMNITTLGLVDAEPEAPLFAWPQPALQHLVVQGARADELRAPVAISAEGRQRALRALDGRTLDVSTLSPGSYILQLSGSDARRLRFVKQ